MTVWRKPWHASQVKKRDRTTCTTGNKVWCALVHQCTGNKGLHWYTVFHVVLVNSMNTQDSTSQQLLLCYKTRKLDFPVKIMNVPLWVRATVMSHYLFKTLLIRPAFREDVIDKRRLFLAADMLSLIKRRCISVSIRVSGCLSQDVCLRSSLTAFNPTGRGVFGMIKG